jgi:DNA-binding CsgD family transcriptional regulator
MLPDHYGTRTLSKREHQLISLVAEGLKNRDIAVALGTTESVVKNYLRRIYDKLGVWSRVELALWFEARRYEQMQAGDQSQGPGISHVSTVEEVQNKSSNSGARAGKLTSTPAPNHLPNKPLRPETRPVQLRRVTSASPLR